MSYVISPGNPNPNYTIPGIIACDTNGILYIINDTSRIN